MTSEQAYRIASRRLGLNSFRRSCRRTMNTTCRLAQAWRVPGTQEAGHDAMLCRMIADEQARLMRGEIGIHGPKK